MKTQRTFGQLIMVAILCFYFFACSEDDPPPDGDGKLIVEDGITADEFERYQGEIGFILNTRSVAKKGYVPSKAMLMIDASSGDYSQTIDLAPISFMGQVKLPVENLDEAAVQELTSGVPVSVTLLDEDGNEIIAGQSLSSVSFLANPPPQNINAAKLEETEASAAVYLKEDTDYFIQQVQEDGTVMDKAIFGTSDSPSLNITGDENSFVGDQPLLTWNFTPVKDKPNTYKILQPSTGLPVVSFNFNFGVIDAPAVKGVLANGSAEEFTFEKVNDGVYQIRNKGKKLIRYGSLGLTYKESGEKVYFRIIAKDISWTAQSIGTTLISPILPEAQIAFGYNSTLKNCGSGELSQTVGADFSEERTNTVGWEESLSLAASTTVSLSATVGVEFDATFFGTGATYTGSVTTGLETTVSATSQRAEYASQSVSQMESYFSSRTITVPSGKASLVYDAYQFYDNVRVDYVQRIRLSGIDENGESLSGEEIKSLMAFSRFNGVVNAVESESVVFNIKGNSVLDRFIETQSSVEDVPSACN